MTPTLQHLFVDAPLYAPFELEGDEIITPKLLGEGFHIDCYCVHCKDDSIFRAADREVHYESLHGSGVFVRDVMCSRDSNHIIHFVFRFYDETLTKIGQFPSLKDLAEGSLRKYKRVLSEGDSRELATAVGLASHGVGIGSFVYLRRIFERLVEEAHQSEKSKAHWNEELYTKSRVDEKIQILKAALPEFLVEQRALYKILSKGLHELSEQECIEGFPILRVGIELILDQKVAEREQQKKLEQAKRHIQALQEGLAKPNDKK